MTIITKARIFCFICNEFTNANISFTLEKAEYQCQVCHVHVSYNIWSIIMKDKCDKCKLWSLGCELSGLSRKSCISQNYKFFKPKALKL